MAEHQAGQKELLMEVRVETQRSCASRQPKVSHGHFKCIAALAVMGFIIVVLVAGFMYHYFTSCNQGASLGKKFYMTYELKNSENRTYDIFIANKTASYLFYGSVVRQKASKESASLWLMDPNSNSRSEIKPKMINETGSFFADTALLVNNTRIRIRKGAHTDCSFHVFEL